MERCFWPEGDDLMLTYHDEEWGVPLHDDQKHFEYLMLEIAQAGLSWRTALHKREGYRKAFADFDPVQVARFTEAHIAKLLLDPGIIRNRLKIEAAVNNARQFLQIQEEFGSFDTYIWCFVAGETKINRWKKGQKIPATSPESDALSDDLKKRGFKFVGSTTMYSHMQAAGLINDHFVHCFRHRECQEFQI